VAQQKVNTALRFKSVNAYEFTEFLKALKVDLRKLRYNVRQLSAYYVYVCFISNMLFILSVSSSTYLSLHLLSLYFVSLLLKQVH